MAPRRQGRNTHSIFATFLNEFANPDAAQSVPLPNFEYFCNGFGRRFSGRTRTKSLSDTLERLFDHLFRRLGRTAGELLAYKLLSVRR